MAARKRPLTQPKVDEMRRRIQSTLLLKRLEQHSLGETEMTPSQIQAARILLDKTIPNLQSVEMTGEGGGPVQLGVTLAIQGVQPKR